MRIVAAPWRRYGKDRTYLAQADGTALGWIDNLTGEVHPDSEDAAALITAWRAGDSEASAVNAPTELRADDVSGAQPGLGAEPSLETHASGSKEPNPQVESSGETTDVQTSPTDWEDLALRRPGQGTRELAKTQLSANWEESRLRTALQVVFDTHTDERAWRMGAAGEEAIGSRLEKLSAQGWRLLHSVPVGENGSDIDHLAIGPGGVWTINAKNHRGKKIWVAPRQIRVDGHVVPYIRNSEFEANRVRKILTSALGWEPFVRSALVFTSGTVVPDVTIKGNPENVDILDRMDVAKRLKREPVRMTAAQVDEVFEIARRSTTWVR